MTKKILSLLALTALLLVVGCTDEDLSPIATFDKSTKGAYPRLLNITAGEFDLQNLSQTIDYTVEFVTLDQGADVAEYRVEVGFVDSNPGNGDMTAEAKTILTATQADFTDNDNGFKQISVSLDPLDLASELGVNPDDFLSGDYYDLSTVITLDDETSYSAANTTPSVTSGGAFSSYFGGRLNLTCPLPDDVFAGTYQVAYAEPPTGGFGPLFGPDPVEVELTLVDGSSTQRVAADLPYLPAFGPFLVDMPINFLCDVVQVAGNQVDTGVGCGSGGILWTTTNTTFDINDDSEFTVDMVEFPEGGDGGCGEPPAPVTLVFTKQ